jgi:hypothetical protein
MKRLLKPMFYTFVTVAVLTGLSEVVERNAAAEAGTCCLTSADCPGTKLCYAPGSGSPNCCTGDGCALKNYCEDKRAD